MPPVPPALKALRDRIDAIDVKLMELLRERAATVEEVRGVKGRLPIYIRPGREADMMRVLLAQPMGLIPKGLVHRLWREMIGAFTLQEGGLSAAVAVPPGEDGLWDYARDHFGSFTPMQPYEAAGDALRAVLNGAHQAAVLPMAAAGDADGWWRHLLAPEAASLKIFYRIPFDGEKGNTRPARHDAVVVAALEPEKTEADRTLFLVAWNGMAPPAAEALLADFPWRPAIHSAYKGADGALFSWIEADGFHMGGTDILESWRARHKEAILHARIAGTYPVPIKLPG